jgi:hypothetical protein
MAQTVNLELSDEIVQKARENAQRTGRSIEIILREWIERGAATEDTASLISNTAYPIYTPLDNDAAASVLLDFLKRSE